MMKLNNKGITTIEVIICFVLVVLITLSMYSTISYFNEKRLLESYKEQIYTYKDLLTKEIQDDFIKVGLTHAEYSKEVKDLPGQPNVTVHTLNCTMKDGTKRTLIIEQRLGHSPYHIGSDVESENPSQNKLVSDYFMIKYGVTGQEIEYPIPKLGSVRYKKRSDDMCKDSDPTANCREIQDLSINNVLISIDEENSYTLICI